MIFVEEDRQNHSSFLVKLDLVNEVPLWPQLFYCLRAGAVDEAVDLASMVVECLRYHVENIDEC